MNASNKVEFGCFYWKVYEQPDNFKYSPTSKLACEVYIAVYSLSGWLGSGSLTDQVHRSVSNVEKSWMFGVQEIKGWGSIVDLCCIWGSILGSNLWKEIRLQISHYFFLGRKLYLCPIEWVRDAYAQLLERAKQLWEALLVQDTLSHLLFQVGTLTRTKGAKAWNQLPVMLVHVA